MQTEMEPEWVLEKTVYDIHEEQLALHGGGTGVRDVGLLQSALARPLNAFHYNQVVSLTKLAACYGFGIAKNHAFIDGNKRTALVVTLTFLALNGYALEATQEETYDIFYALAAGSLHEEALATWLESKVKQIA